MNRRKRQIRAAVIGFPVKHSLSPLIFGELSKRLSGIELLYIAEPVETRALKKYLQAMKNDTDMVGCNVTHPHKVRILEYMDSLSSEAKISGAVNAVHCSRDENDRISLVGYNTDIYGIEKVLKERKFSFKGGVAVIYGAGGAARAVGVCLGRMGAKAVHIANRTLSTACQLSNLMKGHFPNTEWIILDKTSAVPDSVDIYVNATPIGMKGATEEILLPKTIRNHNALAFDLVYGEKQTLFLKTAEANDLMIVSGLDLLVWQAIKTFEIWFGFLTDKEKLKREVVQLCINQLTRRTI